MLYNKAEPKYFKMKMREKFPGRKICQTFFRIFDLQIYKEWTSGAESPELSTQRNNQVIKL